MKTITLDTLAYSAKFYAESDKRAIEQKPDICRFRSDIFPSPDNFSLKVKALTADIVDTGKGMYPYRLRVSVHFDDTADDGRIARFKKAMEQKARFFDSISGKKQELEKPKTWKDPKEEKLKAERAMLVPKAQREKQEQEDKEQQAKAVCEGQKDEQPKKRRGRRKKKSLEDTVLGQVINDGIREELAKGKKKK